MTLPDFRTAEIAHSRQPGRRGFARAVARARCTEAVYPGTTTSQTPDRARRHRNRRHAPLTGYERMELLVDAVWGEAPHGLRGGGQVPRLLARSRVPLKYRDRLSASEYGL